jgi:iron complex transport system permease protein
VSRGTRLALGLALGSVALTGAILLSCALGPQPISLTAAIRGADPDRAILLQLRLPRALLSALVGCALAAAGTALQALLRNPLAEPFVLGVSGGAALGGSLVLVAAEALAQAIGPAGDLLASTSPVALGAVGGAIGATVLVFSLGRIGGRLVPEAALLVGVVFNAFAAGVITVLKVLVSPQQATRLLYWLVGSMGYESPRTLAAGAVLVAASTGALVLMSNRLNLLSLGDEEASALGVDVGRTRGVIFLATSTATGAAVALSGMVGFVGLIVPHLVRRAVGPDHRLLVPVSALLGAVFLVLADLAARMTFLSLGSELPVGALTAFVGGPFFLWLLRRHESRPEDLS